MSLLDKQIEAIKQIYTHIKNKELKAEPIIIGKFALTVYTQGMYPSSVITFLYPDMNTLAKILTELGYNQIGDSFKKDDITIQITNNPHLNTGKFNKIEVDGTTINVLSLEDLLIDMMKECVQGDQVVCDLIKMLINSYRQSIDFHHIFMNTKDKRAIIKFKEFRR
ncbi:MAG: 6-carboxyhexanoate--CoA ligase [Aquificae bacterium]|nr:6-carboxyhexanoate--CoA ligase [Aquificota bacterium]